MNEFKIPENATLAQINESLITCANNLSAVGRQVAIYKADVAIKQTAYKRALARAKVLNSTAKTATMQNALAETDDTVIEKQDELDIANALYIVAQGELEGWDAQFVALRKIVEIKKLERDEG